MNASARRAATLGLGLGCWLAVASLAAAMPAQGEVRLERIATPTAPGGPTTAAAFAPSGNALATAGERGDLLVLELPSRKHRWSAQPSDHWVGVLAFSPDGKQLACCGRDLTFHDAATGRELDRIPGAGPKGFAWSPDGARFVWCRGGTLHVQKVASDEVVAKFEFDYPVNTASVATDGTIHVGDNVGRLWRIAAGARAPVLVADRRRGESDMTSLTAVVDAPGGLFELASAGPLRWRDDVFEVPGCCHAFAATADARSFAVGGAPLPDPVDRWGMSVRQEVSTVRWWSQAGATSRDLSIDGYVAALAFHPSGQHLFVSTDRGAQALHCVDGSTIELPGHAGMVREFVLSADGRMLATHTSQWFVQPVLGGAPRALPGVFEVSAGRRGSEFLLRSEKRVVLFDGATGRELAAVDDEAGPYRDAAAMGPGGRWWCASLSGFVDPSTKQVLALPKGVILLGEPRVDQAVDGTYAIGTQDDDCGTLLVTDANGKQRFVESGYAVGAVAFSPDSSRLYRVRAGCAFRPKWPGLIGLTVWNVRDFSVVRDLTVDMTEWRFLDDQRALACVAGTLQVWDVATLTPVQTLDVGAPCHWFQLSVDRRTLVRGNAYEVAVYRLHRD